LALKQRLLIEGVCGTGKSSLIAALERRVKAEGLPCQVISEEETFGELMDELQAPSPDWPLCQRLDNVLNSLPHRMIPDGWVILERFHPSYYAQIPELERYTAYDQRLAEWGFQLVLLDLPDQALAARSLYRYEREAEGWIEGNLSFYGSEALALQAFQTSQQRRRDYAQLSQMPVQRLDTSSQNWDALAARF
jgi:thymidylate kinase